MKDLSAFNEYIKKKNPIRVRTNNDAWTYTRVSTNPQTDNYSLENQMESAIKEANERGLVIVKTFGQTDESAKSDDDRKEFTEFLKALRKAKHRPYAILVWTMSRFSRTGGGGVGIANEILHKLDVHIIEVSSRLDTTTVEGEIQIFNKLIDARKETQVRLTFTLPGMVKFVKSGKHLGVSPLGYDHFGRKVKDESKWAKQQRIVVNETGTKLRLAWQWKVEGLRDFEIKKKLKEIGLEITLQKLSSMWRNPFYAGIQKNSLVGEEAIMGTWEPMVSIETFNKVKKIIKSNHQGYKVNLNTPDRPLVGTLLCSVCGKKLSGYEVKKKKRHYYKCQRCKGVSINTTTSIRFHGCTGAHELFTNYLSSFEINISYLGLFRHQMEKFLESAHKIEIEEQRQLSGQLRKLEEKKQSLRRKVAMGELSPDMLEFLTEIDKEIIPIRENLAVPSERISNLKKSLDQVIDFTQNISKYWVSSNQDGKRAIQKLVFPEGLVIDTQKRAYLTSKVNSLFSAKTDFTRVMEEQKKEIPTRNGEDSSLVAGAGFEPTAFGL